MAEKEIEIGFHSDVAKDNFTMAQRLLKANGIDWQKNKRLVEQVQSDELNIDPQSILILDEAVLADSYQLDVQLADWVADGGRLIYVLNRQRDELAIDNTVFLVSLASMCKAKKMSLNMTLRCLKKGIKTVRYLSMKTLSSILS